MGLFIVVAGAEKGLLTPERAAMAKSFGLDVPWRLSLFVTVLSNIVSNVPAVLALRPFVPAFPDPHRAWLVVAMASTLTGNLTLIGSVANLIVAERARSESAPIGFMDYFKVGLPLTLVTLAAGTAWLTWRRPRRRENTPPARVGHGEIERRAVPTLRLPPADRHSPGNDATPVVEKAFAGPSNLAGDSVRAITHPHVMGSDFAMSGLLKPGC